MDYICGIDVSSLAVDLCWIGLNPALDIDIMPLWIRLDLGKKGDAFDRARLVRGQYEAAAGELEVIGTDRLKRINWEACWADTAAIGIEQPFGKGLLSTAAGYRVQGAILACLPPEHILYPMPPNTWKAKAGIGGLSNKAAIRAWFSSGQSPWYRGGDPCWDRCTEDELDSCGIALATRVDYLKSNPVS